MPIVSERTGKIIRKQWQITRWPMLISLVWAAIVLLFSKDQNKSLFSFIKDFITALFFVMWFVGQYLRTSKDINDTTNYSNIQTSISDLHKAISKLQSFTPQPVNTLPITSGNTMIVSAKKAIESGYVLAGLMQAGVAFEQAILNKASRLQIPRENRTTITHIINRLGSYYTRNTLQEFFAVWKLRNQLVHLTEEASQELEKSPHLIKYFEWAINQLEAD